jgi:hypothetical protein
MKASPIKERAMLLYRSLFRTLKAVEVC